MIFSWNIDFSTFIKKTTQHKIMTTNMRFNTWIINLWQLVIDYSKYITNLISQKSSTRFTINCLLIQSKSKAMWFLWSLSWISMLLQICFVTLAIGKLSNSNFRFGLIFIIELQFICVHDKVFIFFSRRFILPGWVSWRIYCGHGKNNQMDNIGKYSLL